MAMWSYSISSTNTGITSGTIMSPAGRWKRFCPRNREREAAAPASSPRRESAGTIGAGDYLKERFPGSRIVAGEALQCPTLLMNGYGDHRIEGIGDKHIPWIHNVRNTDVVTAIDDEACVSLVRLFNEPEGMKYLRRSWGF